MAPRRGIGHYTLSDRSCDTIIALYRRVEQPNRLTRSRRRGVLSFQLHLAYGYGLND